MELSYKLNGRQFWLNTGTSVVIKWVNPACYFDSVPGDVAQGVEIPVNDNNRAMLGNPERFDKYSSGNDREFTGFTIDYGGCILLSGTLVITNASTSTYSGWARSNLGNMGKAHREKYIYDIPAFNTDITFVNKANYNPLTDPYGCPQIYNPEFFRDKGRRISETVLTENPDYYPGSGKQQYINTEKETEALTAAFKRTALGYINAKNANNTIKTSSDTGNVDYFEKNLDVYVVSPMMFLNYIIDHVLRDSGFFIDNEKNCIVADTDLQKLILYSNFDITNTEFTTAYNPIQVSWFDGTNTQGRVFKIEVIARNYNAKFKYKDLLPKVKLKDFMLSLQNLLNVCFQFLQNGKVNVIDREAILSGTAIDISAYLLNKWEIGERLNVTLKFTFKHDPDCMFFKERWEDIEDRRPDEKEPVDNWESLDSITDPTIGEVRFLRDLNLYAHYAWVQKVAIDPLTGNEKTTETLGWEHLAMGFQNGLWNRDKENQETIETVFSTLPGLLTPMTYHKGNTRDIKFAYENFTPRLLFYIGNNIAQYGASNTSIDWENETTGLLATRYRTWKRFWCNRLPVTGEAIMPLNVIDYVIRNITSKFRGDDGEFLISEMETEFSSNRVGVTKFKGYKI